MIRAALVCPGRGSYTERSLGSLPPDDPLVRAAEELRRRYELPSLLELDGARRFSAALHLRPANAAALIWTCTMLDAARAEEEHRIVAVGGNSMGWYTALAVAGALSLADGFRLVQEMALLQEEGEPGGQVIYPLVDDDWQRSAERETAVARALAQTPGEVFPSIALGGYTVLAGTKQGVARLLKELPKVGLGKQEYPFQLAQHGPYHTPLARGVSERAFETLATLEFRTPRIPLVDGRGIRFTPWSTDVPALRDYTLAAQVTTPYDLTTSVRVILNEYAPARVVLPGPGNTLGGVSGQIAAGLGWRAIRTRADFDRVQASAQPLVVSLRR